MRKKISLFIILMLLVVLVSCGKKTEKFNVDFLIDGKIHESYEVEKGKTVSEIDAPSKEGFEFKYWTLEDEKYDFSLEITKNIELHALYEEELTLTKIIFNSFNDRNYEVNVDIDYYDIKEEQVVLKYDGDLSSYKDSNVHEIYVSKRNNVEVYLEQGDKWVKLKDQTRDEKYDLFSFFEDNMFDEKNSGYELKNSRFNDLDEYFELEIEFEFSLESLVITTKENKIDTLKYVLNIDGWDYTVTMKFSNYGNVELTIPSV